MKLYRVIEDLQGGTFAMGVAQSAKEWLETMLDWRESDGSFGDWGGEEEDTREYQEKLWLDLIAKGEEQSLIDYIAEIWQLDFQEIGEDLQQAYKTYKQEFDPAEGEPVCFCEWLDNEAEKLGLTPSTENREGAEYWRGFAKDNNDEIMY